MGSVSNTAKTKEQFDPDPVPDRASWLDVALDEGRKRRAAEQDRQQQQVVQAIAEDLNLLLRGKPYSESVLRRAAGLYADLRDVLLAHDPGPARRTAFQEWLHSYKGQPEWEDAADVARHVSDARNSHRQQVREAVALRKAQQSQDRAEGFFGQPAALRLADLQLPDPKDDEAGQDQTVFLTTLKVKTQAGRRSEWVYFCPMTKGKGDPEGLKKLARRYARQLEWEQTEGAKTLKRLVLPCEKDWTKLSAKWRQRKKRSGLAVSWQAYRQEDGSVVVCHDSETEGGDQLQTDLTALVSETKSLLSGMEDDARVRTSEAFGGPWQGSRGDGQAKQAKRQKDSDVQVSLVGQYVTQGGRGLRHAADLLQMDLGKSIRGRKEVDHEDALLVLLEAGYTMTPRKSHKGSLSVFDLLLSGQASGQDQDETAMSHLVYRGSEDEDCTLNVTGLDLPVPQPVLWEGGLEW